MKKITVRELRQRWPEAEKLLDRENEIVVTRDGRAVAKLVRFPQEPDSRPQFDVAEQESWMKEVWGETVHADSIVRLENERRDRFRDG